MTTQYTLSPTEQKQWDSDPELPSRMIKGESARDVSRSYALYRADMFKQKAIAIVSLTGDHIEWIGKV